MLLWLIALGVSSGVVIGASYLEHQKILSKQNGYFNPLHFEPGKHSVLRVYGLRDIPLLISKVFILQTANVKFAVYELNSETAVKSPYSINDKVQLFLVAQKLGQSFKLFLAVDNKRRDIHAAEAGFATPKNLIINENCDRIDLASDASNSDAAMSRKVQIAFYDYVGDSSLMSLEVEGLPVLYGREISSDVASIVLH